MSALERAAAVRRGCGLFRHDDRGLLEVRGGDRARFLQGQLSNDVGSLEPGDGCYALVLTAQGRIVADLHVLARPDCFWLETDAARLDAARERLEKYVIADDVSFADRSGDFARLGLEGPRAPELLEALGVATAIAPDGAAAARIAGAELVVAAWGSTGEPAFQLFVPPEAAVAVAGAILEAGRSCGLVEAGADVLELLRIEAGIPRAGAELGEDVLPAEARLTERAVSFRKGCYTGQEVVARMDSRGRVGHLLVGLAFDGDEPPGRGTGLRAGGRAIGEVTSAARSPATGAIALAYVRSAYAEPGTEIDADGRAARVVPLPFVSPSGGGDGGDGDADEGGA